MLPMTRAENTRPTLVKGMDAAGCARGLGMFI
jgi:hypothetical protein